MKTFLRKLGKLDQIAERWLDTLDGQLQEPIMRAVTGEVFTHGTTSNGHTPAQAVHENGYAAQFCAEADSADEAARETIAEIINPALPPLPGLPNAGTSLLVT